MKIPVFYTPRQVATDNVSESPSAGKPAQVIASWQDEGFPIEIMSPKAAKLADVFRAHDEAHVRAVLEGTKVNGFGNRSTQVSTSLLWTSGSLLSAVRHVLYEGPDCTNASLGGQCGEAGQGRMWGVDGQGHVGASPCSACGGTGAVKLPVAVSPTSGFHHATYDRCQGYCTFNGLMISVLALRAQSFLDRIGILDLDEHWGNGTEDILARHPDVNVEHYSYGGELLERGDGDRWLEERLPSILEDGFRDCALILYQAGADPHRNDPGSSRGILDDAQLLRRDRIVFEFCKAKGIPVVWNLAGGYQRPLRKVLDIHDNTMRACVEVFG